MYSKIFDTRNKFKTYQTDREFKQTEKMFFLNVVGIFTLCWGISHTADLGGVGESCTITEFSQVSNVVNNCKNIVIDNLIVPAWKTLTLRLKKGSSLSFQGTTIFEVSNWEGPLILIEGDDLKVEGKPGSKLDGQGAKYWDGKGDKGVQKPGFIRISGSGEFSRINLLNCPRQCASIHGSHISIDGWNIDVSAGDKNKLGHNTDGFDISGHEISVKNSVVKNQDDCLVVNRGTNMHFRGLYCSGGHGLSLSVGMNKKLYDSNVVSNVTFTNCTVMNSINGIHIKTHKDAAKGLIKDVTYSGIILKGIEQYGMRIHQDYPEDDKKPVGNIPIQHLRISNVKGDMSGQFSTPVNVMCASGACSDWIWSDISIHGNNLPCSMNYKPTGFSC